MFRNLFKRQLVDEAISLRFLLYSVLILAGMAAFAMIFIGQHHARVENFNRVAAKNSQSLQSAASSLSNLLRTTQTILMEPRAAGFIADGHEGRLPRGLEAGMQRARLASEPADPRTALLPSPDATSIVQLIFSFFALVLTFNAVSNEKEKGTLRLVLSNSVPKAEFLLAKYLSAVTTLGIPFVTGLILCLVLLAIGGVPVFSGDFMTVVLLFLVLSFLYLSFFVLLGLFCSTAGTSSKNSLVLCLLLWVLIVVILPRSAGPLLRLKTFSVPTGEAVAEAARLAGREVWDRYKGQNLITAGPEAESTKLNVRVMNESALAEERVHDLHLDRKIRTVKTLMAVNCVSPAALFEYGSAAAAGTGVSRFEYFRRQVGQYQDALVRFFEAQDRSDPDSPHLLFHPDYVSKKPFDPGALPQFKEREPGLAERMKSAAAFGVGLILFNTIMFALAFVSFLRYDVR